MRRYSGHIVRVLHRLPLCAAGDLAALCGLPWVTVHRHLSALVEAGWVVRLNLTDPACGPPKPREPVYAISEPARLELLANLARAEADFGPAVGWHLRPRSLPDAITSAPIARAAISCLAQLARAIEIEQDGHLVQVMARSPRARGESLPWGHYEGRWHRDEEHHASEARFAVHVDRDRLPQARRRALVRGWLWRAGGRAGRRQPLLPSERYAPVLVICETEPSERQWHELCRQEMAEHGWQGSPVMLTATVDAIAEDWSLDDTIWRRAGSWRNSDRIPLASVQWRWGPASADERPIDGGNEPLPRLADRATARKPLYPGAGLPQRSATLALKLTRYQHRVIDLLARHPSLSARDLGRYSGVSYERADRECRSMPGGAVVATRYDDGERRYLITDTSLRLTSARAGMGGARKRFAFLNNVRWASPDQPDQPAPRDTRLHDIGAYRAVGLLVEHARAAGMDVRRDFLTERDWRESQQITIPLPDGGCTVWMDEDEDSYRQILVEYERPQRGPERFTKKLTNWVRWYRQHPGQRPLLLVVWDETCSRPNSPPRSIRAMHPPAPGMRELPVVGASARDLEDGGYSAACWLRPDGEFVSLEETLRALA